ncbi:MAG: hypothetical protein MR607_07460 [Lachnospiraceae bacterium]|nr:hypothetical protein [Lachnospiraceae bacterium]
MDHILAGIDSGSNQTREELSINSAYIIAAITLASRAAVKGGMDYGYAMAEHERYLERIRTDHEPEEHALIFIDAFHIFTEQIARIRQNETASPISRHVSGYIQNHLYEKITPQHIADALHIN